MSGRRWFIAIGTQQCYLDEAVGSPDPLGVSRDIGRVSKVLVEYFGYEPVLPQLAWNPGLTQLKRDVNEFLTESVAEADSVIVYVSGHGRRDDKTNIHYLVLHETKGKDHLPGTAIKMAELVEKFPTSKARELLVIIDVCYAEGAAHEFDSILSHLESSVPWSEESGKSFHAIFACRGKQLATAGRFSSAFESLPEALRKNEREFVLLDEIIGTIHKAIPSNVVLFWDDEFTSFPNPPPFINPQASSTRRTV